MAAVSSAWVTTGAVAWFEAEGEVPRWRLTPSSKLAKVLTVSVIADSQKNVVEGETVFSSKMYKENKEKGLSIHKAESVR